MLVINRSKSKLLKKIAILLISFGCVYLISSAYADTTPTNVRAVTIDSVKQKILTLPGKMNKIIYNKKNSKEKRVKQAFKFISQELNFHLIGQVVIGPTWRTISKSERANYLNLFSQWAQASIAARISALSKTKLTFKSIQNSGGMGKDIYVNETAIAPDSGNQINVTWRLRWDKKQAQYKIIDLIVANVSLITTQRAEFTSYINQHGKDAFFQMLKNQIDVQEQYFFSNLP